MMSGVAPPAARRRQLNGLSLSANGFAAWSDISWLLGVDACHVRHRCGEARLDICSVRNYACRDDRTWWHGQ
jgi:hypothetical protein